MLFLSAITLITISLVSLGCVASYFIGKKEGQRINQPVVWRKAWKDGYSYAMEEMENQYSD